MVRGVLSGLSYGALVSVLGLAGASLMLPPPQLPRPEAARETASTAPDPRNTPPVLPTPGGASARAPVQPPEGLVAAPQPPSPPTSVAIVPGPGPGVVAAPAEPGAPQAADDPAPALPQAQPAPPSHLALAPAAPPSASLDGAASAQTDTAPAARPKAAAPAQQPQVAPDTAAAALAEPPRAEAPIPVAPPGAVTTPALVPAAPAPDAVGAPAPVPMMTISGAGIHARPFETPEPAQEPALPAPEPGPEAAPAPRQTGFVNAPGVRVGRLPTVGGPAVPADPAPEPAPSADLPAWQTHAQRFEAPAGQPLLSVVLIDPGVAAGGLDFATLSTIDFPVTIAIDPTRPDAAKAAQGFRKAGFEVAILAAGLPAGATPSDLEVAVEAWRAALPEAVAVVEPANPAVQNNRALSQQLVRILDRDGMALITQAQGLNAAAQIARGEGVAQTSVWKVLDGNREDAAAIERGLERAAFEATRGGALTVMLSGWPESVSGLLRWQPDAARALALAPVSAVLKAGQGAE